MEDLLDVQKLVIQLNSARRKIGELEAKIEALDSQKNEESQWLWCHRRLDEIEAQIAILKSKRRDMSPESLTEESALTRAEKAEDHLLILKAENRALIREITALQKKCGLEDARQTLPGSNLSSTSKTLDDLHQAVAKFPSLRMHPPQSNHFCLRDYEKLDEFLAEAAPAYDWEKLKFFFFPGRTMACRYHSQHYLTFAPRGQKIPNTEYRILPRFRGFGHEHHLFVGDSRRIQYAGLYTIKTLSHVAPEGCKLPIAGVEISLLVNLAHRDSSGADFPSKQELQRMYNLGELQFECVGLQCVGFDMELHTRIEAFEQRRSRENLRWEDSRKRKRPYLKSSDFTSNIDNGWPERRGRSLSPKRKRQMFGPPLERRSRSRNRSTGPEY